MNRDKKIVFMGTPQFAVEALKKLHESKLTFSNVKPSYLKTLWSQIEN